MTVVGVDDFLRFLIADGLVPQRRSAEVLETVSLAGVRPDTAVLDLGLASEGRVLDRLGRWSRSRTVSGTELSAVSPELIHLVPPRMATRFGIIPFARDGKTLKVAAMNPGDLLIQDELGVLTGCLVVSYAALEVRIQEALARYYGAQRTPQMVALARRLSTPQSTADHASATEYETVATKDSPSTPPPPLVPSAGARPPARAEVVRPSELEISDEDLELFPSLRVKGEDDTQESAVLAPSEPAVAPGSEPAAESAPTGWLDAHVEPEADDDLRLLQAASMLQNAEMRDDIADALLHFCGPLFKRRMLLTIQRESVVGWRGEGEGVDVTAVRAVAVPRDEPSVFKVLLSGTEMWRGPLPPMPRNQEIILSLGDPAPADCLVLPIRVRSKTVAFLYGDALDGPLGAVPVATLKRLLAKTDLAFQVYLLKNKIRTL
jgi:hypothetical protein